jgi:alkanesulfonate monooxygenase SsuD/methylene tetrahydromethanopterin reductase-like flavin-dependent oxidoreductase (luciferase family)
MELKLLAPQFRSLMTPDFLTGKSRICQTITLHVKDFQRGFSAKKPDPEHLLNIVEKAMQKFSENKRDESDRWLAPRVHATLRLTRREAAESGLWSYLSVEILQDYVRWRWKGDDETVAPERFLCGQFNKHAIARLWWGAELTRNGADYSGASLLFTNQDLQNIWVKTRLFRHRPTAIASLRLLSTFENGEFADSNTIRDLIKSFNMAITTTMLDAVAPSLDVDAATIRDWCEEDVDETTMFEEMPVGPPEQPVYEEHIEAVTELLKRVIRKTRFVKRRRSSKAPASSST